MKRTCFKSGVYIILNTINGFAYIGSSTKVLARIKAHKYDLNKGDHCNIYLQEDWDNYGKDAFLFKVIKYCNKEELHFYEQEWIDSYKDKNLAYNIYPTAGSPLGSIHTDKTKEKMSNTRKEYWKTTEHPFGINNPFFGKTHSDKTKDAISKANKGRLIGNQHALGNRFKHTPEELKKMKDAWTPEMREAQSNRLKGKIAWNKGLK